MDSQVFLFNDNLKSISIPNTMQAVGDFAFGGCRNLESIVCDATTPPTAQQYTFYGVQPEKCSLTVPETSKAAYREAIGWKDLMTDSDPVGVDLSLIHIFSKFKEDTSADSFFLDWEDDDDDDDDGQD